MSLEKRWNGLKRGAAFSPMVKEEGKPLRPKTERLKRGQRALRLPQVDAALPCGSTLV